MTETVGFVGLGIMGKPMAENLAKKFSVIGFDTQPERLAGVRGPQKATDLQSVAACSVICLSLPSAAIVESVLLGPQGLAPHLKPGTLVIDLSTGLPEVSRRIAQTLASGSVDYVDAPVSGGEAGAVAATLAIMVGGTQATYERSQAYLKAIGSSVVHVGAVGAGNVAKLVNNMIVGVTFVAVAEAFALADQNGVKPELLFGAIRGGWAGSKVLEVSAPSIMERRYPPGGTIDMIRKDLGYAQAMAAQSSVSIPMTKKADELFQEAQAVGRGAQAQPAVFELWSRPGDLR